MELSTTTLIEAVNKVLENIGERRVLALTSPVARKCVTALQEGLQDLATIHDWEWTRDRIPAISWVGDTADLGNTQRVHGVAVGSSTQGFHQIQWVDEMTFDSHPVLPYAMAGDKPSYYTISSYNKVRLSPYPVTSEQQAQVYFYVTKELAPPRLLEEYFPVPERLMTLVIYRACHYMAVSHLDDDDAANQWAKQFEAMVMRVRDRERLMPTRGVNMFKLRR